MPKPVLRRIKPGQAYRFTLPDDLAELLNRRAEKLGILPKKLFIIALYDYFARNPELRYPFDDAQQIVEKLVPSEVFAEFDKFAGKSKKKGGGKNARE